MEHFLSREQISHMLAEQLEQYNMQHPGEEMDTEGLCQKAYHSYYRNWHPDRYTILWKWLEPEEQEPDFIKQKREKYKENTVPSKKPLVYFNKEALAGYLNGDYGKYRENNSIYCSKEHIEVSSLLFYTLARASGMDESDMIAAYYESGDLDILEYNTYCVYDIFEYYYSKSELESDDIGKKTSLRGFQSTTISNLLNRSISITFEQFLVLAEILEIPDKWTKFCKYRLAQQKDRLPYRTAYTAFEKDLMENLDEALTSLYSCENRDRSKKYGTVSKLYRQMGYLVLSDVFPKQVDTKDRNAMGNTYMEIIKPDFSRHQLSLEDYEAVIKRVLAFARFCMISRLQK